VATSPTGDPHRDRTSEPAPTDAPPLLELARAATPGLVEIEAALSEVEERLRQAVHDARPEDDAADGALPDVLAGRGIPDDLGHQVLAIRRENEAAATTVLALNRLRDRLHGHRQDVHVSSTPTSPSACWRPSSTPC